MDAETATATLVTELLVNALVSLKQDAVGTNGLLKPLASAVGYKLHTYM